MDLGRGQHRTSDPYTRSSMALSASFLINSTIPCVVVVSHYPQTDSGQEHQPYLRHDWLAILTFHISEGHLGTLVLVELELREVEVRHLGDRN